LEINDTNNPSTIYGEEEERKRREKEIKSEKEKEREIALIPLAVH